VQRAGAPGREHVSVGGGQGNAAAHRVASLRGGVASMQDGGMGEIVNLRQARKRLARTAAEREAERNRARFGRSAADKLADRQQQQRQRAVVDHAKLEPDEPA